MKFVYHLPDDRQLKESCAKVAAGPSPSPDECRPEVLLTEAYQRLEDHPGETNDDFWRAERWFSREFREWTARYEKCGRGVEIWGEGGSRPAVRDVAIGRATAGPKGMVSESFPVRDYRAQRLLSRLDDEGASASVEFTYRDRYRINGFTDTKENRRETRHFLFVREDGKWLIDGVSTGFGGMDGTHIPSDSALTKACKASSSPGKGGAPSMEERRSDTIDADGPGQGGSGGRAGYRGRGGDRREPGGMGYPGSHSLGASHPGFSGATKPGRSSYCRPDPAAANAFSAMICTDDDGAAAKPPSPE